MGEKEKTNRLVKYFDKKAVSVSVYLTLVVMRFYNFSQPVYPATFNRTFGHGTVFGSDISVTIHKFYSYMILLPILYFILWFVLSRLWQKSDDVKGKKWIRNISIIGLLPLIFLYVNSNSMNITNIYFFTTIVFSLFILFQKFDSKDEGFLQKTTCLAIALSVPFYSFFLLLYPQKGEKVALLAIVSGFITLNIVYQVFKLNKKTVSTDYWGLAIILALPIYAAGLEFSAVINQYSMPILSPKFLAFVVYPISILIGLLCIIFKKKDKPYKESKNTYYILILLGLSLLYAFIGFRIEILTDLFESANGGTVISQLFLYNQFPVIENYSAHMLSDSIWGIIYGVLNNDYTGAIFSPYRTYAVVIMVLFLYLVLKKCVDIDVAFLLILALPLINSAGLIFLSLGLAIVLSQFYMYKNKTWMSYFFFWLTIALTCLYQLDIGVAYGVGAVLSVFVLDRVNKVNVNIKRLFITLILVFTIFITLFVAVCLVKNIPVLPRIKEFIGISSNNTHWSYSTIGDINKNGFFLSYYLIPAFVAFIAFFTIYKIIHSDKKAAMAPLIILLTLSFSYFVNIPRILVRHNMLEKDFSSIAWTFPLIVIVFISIFFNKKHQQSFIVVAVIGMAITFNSIVSDQVISTHGVLDASYNNVMKAALEEPNFFLEKQDRVLIKDEMKLKYEDIVSSLNSLLMEEETFIDFTNQTLLYSLSKRNKPVYVSQSPALVSGEFGQSEFISSIKKAQAPLAILPSEEYNEGHNEGRDDYAMQLDEVKNSFRHYKIAEYIYSKYVPVASVGAYNIWSLKEKEAEYKEISTPQLSESISIKDNLYKLVSTNSSLELVHNELVITSKNQDPQLTGFEELSPIDKFKNLDSFELEIEYCSDIPGTVELFYSNADEAFSQKASIMVTTALEGTMKIEVPYHNGIKYRFDTPGESVFTIKSLQVNYSDFFTSFDKVYQLEAHDYFIGEIAFLWANRDKQDAAKNKLVPNGWHFDDDSKELSVKTGLIQRTDGNYILAEINSEMGTVANLTMTNSAGDKTCIYRFNVHEGINNYLIRISSDYLWYIDDTYRITVSESEEGTPITVTSMSVLKGD